MDPSEYCREIETYLCRKNEGHLIRIVGPAFERVCGWSTQGVPLKVVFRGIDLYCERYYSKGPRRRPVRIEFCEADVFDLFDAWRRAVGVAAGSDGSAVEAVPRKPSLAAHLERVIARLATTRSAVMTPAPLQDVIAQAIRDLEAMNAAARQARGEARTRMIETLVRIDREVMDACTAAIDQQRSAALRREAEAELAPFGSRLASDTRTRAAAAAFERLLREALSIPVIAYD
jgi:hypothetical protein